MLWEPRQRWTADAGTAGREEEEGEEEAGGGAGGRWKREIFSGAIGSGAPRRAALPLTINRISAVRLRSRRR